MDKLFLPDDDENKYKGPPLPHYLTVLLQLACGLEYIHSKSVVHRDIKPGNVLISLNNFQNDLINQEVTFKWADFGLSKSNVTGHGSFSKSGLKGSQNWMAPEDILGESDRGTLKSDVYSEGLVFGYYILKGVHLLGKDDDEINKNRKEGKIKNAKS